MILRYLVVIPLLAAVVAGCSASVTGGQQPTLNPRPQTGPLPAPQLSLAGAINGRAWTPVSGDARYDSSRGTQMLALNFWTNPARVPCSAPTLADRADLQVYAHMPPIVGTATFDTHVSLDGPNVGFAYLDTDNTQINNVAYSGSFTIATLTSNQVTGSFDAAAGDAGRGKGSFSVPICP